VNGRMRIGQLADRAGVTPRTIRYYESLGLLGPNSREGAGFRYYTEAELFRLQKINELKELGFTLEEIANVAPLYFDHGVLTGAPSKILEILNRHLQETNRKIATLMHLKTELEANIDRIQLMLEETDHFNVG
jgi:MerR family transcriptional regulator, copper efflux regulator